MSETEGAAVSAESLIEYLKTQPWCKQGDSVLVAVAKGTPEIVDHLANHEVKVFPGGVTVKLQKSVLTNFKSKYEEEQPLPVVLVWKPEGLEVWYRKHNPSMFPYDAWADQAVAAHEQERVLIPAAEFGPTFMDEHASIAAKVKECPTMMPPY